MVSHYSAGQEFTLIPFMDQYLLSHKDIQKAWNGLNFSTRWKLEWKMFCRWSYKERKPIFRMF